MKNIAIKQKNLQKVNLHCIPKKCINFLTILLPNHIYYTLLKFKAVLLIIFITETANVYIIIYLVYLVIHRVNTISECYS